MPVTGAATTISTNEREREREAVSFNLGSRVSLVKEDATEAANEQLMSCQEYGKSKRVQLLSSDGVTKNSATVFFSILASQKRFGPLPSYYS